MPSAFDEFIAEISRPTDTDPFAQGNKGENPFEDSQSSKTDNQQPPEGTDGASSQDDKDAETKQPFHKNPRWQKMVEKVSQSEAEKAAMKSELEQLKEMVQKMASTSNDYDDVPMEWLAIHGDNENSRKAWSLQSQMQKRAIEEAKAQILKEQAQLEAESQKETVRWQNYIDSELETLEDEFGVDLTSDAPAAKKARTEFLGLVQRLSPKDENGDVTSFADFRESWEYYKSKQSKPDNNTARKQELAARSMARSNEAPTPEDRYTAGEGFGGIRARLGI